LIAEEGAERYIFLPFLKALSGFEYVYYSTAIILGKP
jgi:hypothetical protein